MKAKLIFAVLSVVFVLGGCGSPAPQDNSIYGVSLEAARKRSAD